MKNLKKYLGLCAGALTLGVIAQSCAVDQPFEYGDGVLQMKLVLNSELTRAETDVTDLAANAVIYISGQKGLLHKYVGVENVPDQIPLKGGHYVAEAWTGDSVSASFDKKFYRGYQPFDINNGLNQVVLTCRIANVVVSVNNSTIDSDLMKDWNINVAHSRANLDFTAENMDYAKGYFMMPNADKDLTVTVTGKNAEGKAFTKVQTIPNVERAHEYILNFSYNPQPQDPTDGGAFITITVDDTEVEINSEVTIYGCPVVRGVDFDVDRQIIGEQGAFSEKILKVNAFGSIEHFILQSSDYAAMNMPSEEIDMPLAVDQVISELATAGITRDESFNADKNLVTSYLTLSKKWLNSLPQRDTEYVLNLTVTDKYGKSTQLPIRIAVGEGAIVIDDPVTADPVPTDDLLAVRSTSATLSGSIVDASAENAGIQYREAGTSTWTFVPASSAAQAQARRRHLTPAQALRAPGVKFSVTVSGLKPGTRYEYQAVSDGFASESMFFTTEGQFVIPNGSFETWGSYTASTLLGEKTVKLPGASRATSFWESGNEGAATADLTLTDKSTAMLHSGTYSASLESKSAMGVIAAGNIFAGVYVKTDGTNGVLSLGRDFDGSHPDALSVWVNYRPASGVKIKSGNESYVSSELTSGGTDCGQIYVALTTEEVEIRTNPKNRKLFDPNGDEVVAYGQVTWTGNFGPDGGLERVEIPLTYKSSAKTTKPLKVVIVTSASKYGDYFSGASGSKFYLDDFEFVYK